MIQGPAEKKRNKGNITLRSSTRSRAEGTFLYFFYFCGTKTLFCSQGSDSEGEVALLRIDEVLLPWPGSPGVHTAESHLPLLDVNLCQRTLNEVA